MNRGNSNRRCVILIVEDNPNARQLIRYMLSNAGYRIVETDDGDEAVRLLDNQRFDLIITDLALPHTTGFGIIAHAHAKWPRLPIILITGYLGRTAAEQILNEYVEYIPKPIDRDRLLATVNRFVSVADLSEV
jgi:DNA-binding NtrC family response regulator